MGHYRHLGHLGKMVAAGLGVSGAAALGYSLLGDRQSVFAAAPVRPHPMPPHGPKWDGNWDKRDPISIAESSGLAESDDNYQAEVEKAVARATRHVFLIRHGQYNMGGVGDKERYLTELGRQQAELTGKRLLELNFPYTRLIRSTMTRAQETAEIILTVLKPESFEKIVDSSLLEEGAPVPPEPPVGHWRPDTSQFYEDGPRIEAAFRKFIHRASPSQTEDSYDIVVCHGNVIRYFVCRALQFPAEAWLRFTLHHCSITWLAITPSGRVIVRTVGDCGHLPSQQLTTS